MAARPSAQPRPATMQRFLPTPCLPFARAMAIKATIVARASCTFNSNAALNIGFGAINPLDSNIKTASVQTAFRCIGWGLSFHYSLTANDGQHPLGAGARRMKHVAANDYLPYSLGISPDSGPAPLILSQTVTITASIAPVDYRNAREGGYSDTVVLTLNP